MSHFNYRTAGASLALTIAAAMGSNAFAHPSFLNGGMWNGSSFKNNTPTAYQTTVNASVRGVIEDAIRIGHGCDLDGVGGNTDPVVAVSWVWPEGKGANGWDDGMAPMSTGCSAAGNECTGGGSQPAVARIPDSSKKAHLAAGQGVATTLASEIVEGTTSGAPTGVPMTSVGGRMNFSGNLGYFVTNQLKANGSGFYARNNKYNAAQIAAMGISSAGAPFHNGIQVLYAVDRSTTNIRKIAFSSSSCARKLVVRPAGADICKLSSSHMVENEGHTVNYWFGGPTGEDPRTTFTDGHGIHENFWLNYVLAVRDTSVNPYPSSCTDQVNGDYDLVVMPTKYEINRNLPFPGFATRP